MRGCRRDRRRLRRAGDLRTRLPHLSRWTGRRTRIAARNAEALAQTAVRPLARLEGRRHVFHLFVVEAPDRDVLGAHLDKAGVATLIHYPTPIHRLPPDRRLADGPVPRDDEVERIVDALGTVA